MFEYLAEYLNENIVGRPDLEIWFDRPLAKDLGDSFGVSPHGFPQVVTSQSLKNIGGGYVDQLRSIREVKIDAVKEAIQELTPPRHYINWRASLNLVCLCADGNLPTSSVSPAHN